MPLITVIIPIYNAEDYLRQCLDSVVNQTVSNHNAVMVDDGSTDGSGEIAAEYAAKYPDMFTLIKQKNRGQGAARNEAIKHSDGRYIMFLDSDDWLIPTTVENIEKAIQGADTAPDAVFMKPVIYNMTSRDFDPWYDSDILDRVFENVSETCPADSNEMYALEISLCRTAWSGGLIREENPIFPEGVKWEDVPPHFHLYHKLKHCVMAENAGFFYRTNSGKQTTSGTGISRLDVVPMYKKVFDEAVRDGWTPTEGAYVVKLLLSFTQWSVRMSTPEIREKLTKGLHGLYRQIPSAYFRTYLKKLCHGRKDRFYSMAMRLPVVYKIPGDFLLTQRCRKLAAKIKRVLHRG